MPYLQENFTSKIKQFNQGNDLIEQLCPFFQSDPFLGKRYCTGILNRKGTLFLAAQLYNQDVIKKFNKKYNETILFYISLKMHAHLLQYSKGLLLS